VHFSSPHSVNAVGFAATPNAGVKLSMAKEEVIEMDGVVTEVLRGSRYRVALENGHEVSAYTAGKMRKFRIRVVIGDKVTLQISPYDLTKGRISFRHKN